jgi:hypothetical protein
LDPVVTPRIGHVFMIDSITQPYVIVKETPQSQTRRIAELEALVRALEQRLNALDDRCTMKIATRVGEAWANSDPGVFPKAEAPSCFPIGIPMHTLSSDLL